ncbi:unnamed protein product [Linum tenue]|uniref:Uncharacterized protein n=1 Tax=Linum tenue TaxID=586396 RepID=A0AAV0MIG8_9ROSI|nr:unnamed protein product [Linum tenue]
MWMYGASWDSSYIWPCTQVRKMQIALYLVREPMNYIRHTVLTEARTVAPQVEAAVEEYKKAHERRKRKEKSTRKPSRRAQGQPDFAFFFQDDGQPCYVFFFKMMDNHVMFCFSR